jgi:peptidoglycan hydrolase-like protein with peptidoglycan-binding domain
MIAGLDSASPPSAGVLAQAKAHGVKMWSGYLATKDHVNLLRPWTREEFGRVKAAGLSCLAFCSGQDDPVACKNRAAEWGVRLCLDVESGIRGDGPWVQDWLTKSHAGLYGNAPVFRGRKAPFYVLAAYPGSDPGRTWPNDRHNPRPNGPHGWQWRGTHTEFGSGVDRGWYDDWFAGGAAAPPFPYPANHFLGCQGTGEHCHFGKDAAEQANVSKWQRKMAQRGWPINATGTFDKDSQKICRKFQAKKDLVVDGKVGPDTWATTWTAPRT